MAILTMYSISMIVFLISIFLFHVLKFRRKFWIQVFHGLITNNTLLLPRDWPICSLKISKGLEKKPKIWQNLDPKSRKRKYPGADSNCCPQVSFHFDPEPEIHSPPVEFDR